MRLQDLKRLDWLVTLGCLTLLGYFAWQGFLAPHGFAYLETQRAVLAEKQRTAAAIQQARMTLEDRVSLVRTQSLDPDMVDELARKELGWVGPNDVVVTIADRNP